MLYGCETWSLTLWEESRLRVFENRILRRIFGLNMDEKGEWRRLHNEELHSLYRSPNIVRVIKSRRRWEDNIRRYLKEIGINTRNWVDLIQGRNYWRACECSIEPPGYIIHGVSYKEHHLI